MAHARILHIEAQGDAGVMAGCQMLFDHLVAQRTPPRPASIAARQRAAAATTHRLEQATDTECATAARKTELDRLRVELHRYIRELGEGHEFQACDFITRLHDMGCPPDPAIVDPRCTGALFRELLAAGSIECIAYRPNAGNPHTGYGSTTRPVYRIRSAAR